MYGKTQSSFLAKGLGPAVKPRDDSILLIFIARVFQVCIYARNDGVFFIYVTTLDSPQDESSSAYAQHALQDKSLAK